MRRGYDTMCEYNGLSRPWRLKLVWLLHQPGADAGGGILVYYMDVELLGESGDCITHISACKLGA